MSDIARVCDSSVRPPGGATGTNTLDLSILFPACNEETTIVEVVEEAENVLRNSGYRYELIVLDDGSTDRTRAMLESLSEAIATLRILRHERNQGIMVSLDDLFHAARGEWVFHNGSDGQWKTAEVLRMIPMIGEYDLIVGRRKAKHYNLTRKIVSCLFNISARFMFGVKTHDAGSIKLMPKKIVDQIHLTSRGPFREAERLIRASARGYRIGWIWVDSYPRRAGVARGAKLELIWLSILDLIRCWWDIVILRHK